MASALFARLRREKTNRQQLHLQRLTREILSPF
jgi:hypothetical protein